MKVGLEFCSQIEHEARYQRPSNARRASSSRYDSAMTIRKVLARVLVGLNGLCVAVYLAAVSLNGQVTSTVSWWPYPWLSLVIVVFIFAGIAWIALEVEIKSGVGRQKRPVSVMQSSRRPATVKPVPQRSVPAVSTPKQNAPASPKPVKETPAVLRNGSWVWNDLRATPRATDGRLVVTLHSSGQRIGILTHRKGGYEAIHGFTGVAGWYPTMSAALNTLFEREQR
jgi:hypothetical protein